MGIEKRLNPKQVSQSSRVQNIRGGNTPMRGESVKETKVSFTKKK